LPLVTIIGISLVTLLEGAFFAEVLMGIPGIGREAFDSVKSRDYDVILGLALVLAAAFIVANIVIDIAYTFIDPRVRYQRSGVT
jgi:peptide/nickel transport system permease protein